MPLPPLVQSSMHGHVNAEFSRNSFLGPFCPETDFSEASAFMHVGFTGILVLQEYDSRLVPRVL